MSEGRRLTPREAASILARAEPIAVRPSATIEKSPVRGVTVRGEVIHLPSPDPWQLLLFVTSNCHGCDDLLVHLGEGGSFGLERHQVIVVSHDSDPLDVPGIQSVMSDETWRRYQVTGPPFYSLIAAESSVVVTEGVAWGVSSIEHAVSAAQQGRETPAVHRFDA